MKTLLILSALLLVAINLSAQDSEPSPLHFSYIANGQNYTNQALNKEHFQQNNFIISTQWEGHSRMLQALKFNMNHGKRPRNDWSSNSDRVSSFPNISDSGYTMKYIWSGDQHECRGFQYSPTLFIPENRQGEFIYQAADNRRSVFGFSYIRDSAQVINNPSSTIYKLYNDSTDYIDSVVLGKTWINNKFYVFGNPGLLNYDHTTGGTRWIFSINLRRLDIEETANNDDLVLSIKLPYIKRLTTKTTINGIINFSFPPKTTLNDTVRLKYLEDRGFAMKMTDLPVIGNTIYITNRMLPDRTFFENTGRQDITINAEFICNQIINPQLIAKGDTLGIEKIDIEVKYHGNRDVGINYCRIATPAGYDFVTGKSDSLIQAFYQAHINLIQSENYEIFGFYGSDEFPEHYYLEQRYKTHVPSVVVIIDE
ncbi:MAG: hypothetical protein CVV22_00870 [Ignavibacteriae bacterium HGW-Ignavibacteriae-1]|jgi:hypothetical protein|nr:MAG: hypothetical protein CVV22_00870 [Ignavibacteriae bacterium HGW-Ignavibacteriae-1]